MTTPGSGPRSPLASWTAGEHTAAVAGAQTTHPTYRKGSGPGVVVVHEIPGLTEGVVGFAQETDVTTPVAGWLRSLARELHAELGGPGVGALGMCFTGGFALAMMVEESTVAPVLCQPSAPFSIGAKRSADLNLSPADRTAVVRRAAGGCSVLGLRYAGDPAVGTRFDTLSALIGDAFIRVDLPGKGHSTVTEHRSQVAVDAVLAFFAERLHARTIGT